MSRRRAVLGIRRRLASLERGENLDEQTGTELRQPGRQRRSGVVGADGDGPHRIDGPRVEPGVHAHDRYPGLGVARKDGGGHR